MLNKQTLILKLQIPYYYTNLSKSYHSYPPSKNLPLLPDFPKPPEILFLLFFQYQLSLIQYIYYLFYDIYS
jgi:hypothetical protein